MSQTKKRGAFLLVLSVVVVVAVAIFVTADAWTFVPANLIVLVIHLASPVDDKPDVPNHPIKVWLFGAGACFGVVLIVLGVMSKPADIAFGAILLVLSLPALWMVHQGRNPWWMRGWADYSRHR